ncbi:hypothetical protein CCO03_15150 [Comamonas serinivorans]|uniref:Nitroreductase domain-containing protein n=1 Tax=Comamonas serinivorans TaxID=1082851 RepID=A0A1Y0EQY7_9BURK|nr:nitroreductase family protein [Comamonas serinivorans]ARU05840.1 hypothetical protein CCO03_15150 [Comamonas serinivorans]
MTDSLAHDAPLFALYWTNNTLNPARAGPLAERIGYDAATPYRPPHPVHARAADPLPVPRSGLLASYARRRSVRRLGGQPLTPGDLSRLLVPLAARQSAWGHGDDGYDDAGRYLASGGAKYPIQAYGVLLNWVDAHGQRLAPQRVWYDPACHGLTPLGAAPDWPQLASWLGLDAALGADANAAGDWATPPACIWLLAGQSAFSCRKYGERGGRFMLLEAGSQMGALALQAAEAGLVGTALGSFHDQALLDLFELGPDHQALVVYACGHPAS